MATFLFWNLDKQNLTADLVTLCHENEVDVLILAESEGIEKIDLLEAVNRNQPTKFIEPLNYSVRLSFFVKEYYDHRIKNIRDDTYVAIREISLPTDLPILLVALHLPSKLYIDESGQICQAIRIIETIQKAEKEVGHTNTLVIGDFNMNPFEKGLVLADAFHAVMDRQIAKKRSRKVYGQEKLYFYNPMWGKMGDTSEGPSGTYFYPGGGYLGYFWNTFDQVLLRPNLIDYFSDNQLRVIGEIGQKDLLVNIGKKKKKTSDHLPIMITLKEVNSS